MRKGYQSDLKWSDVTPEAAWLNRRQLMAGAVAGLGLAAGPAKASFSTDEEPNTWEEITSYNNFYEFGTGKDDPARFAHMLTTDPWAIEIGGLVERPGTYDLSDILKGKAIEERIYRLRCVEAWSMVVPWNGFELRALLEQVGVQPSARYVAFETAVRPDEMPGLRYSGIEWPYREGLRLDEAMHPLTLLATGVYGRTIANQNGAPIRLVVPWKYGYKSIKSIVKITLVEDEPPITWNMVLPNEYKFYSNVDPAVDHPRWSQATERRIGGGLFSRKIPTLPYNGYGEYVADLYAGMDTNRLF